MSCSNKTSPPTAANKLWIISSQKMGQYNKYTKNKVKNCWFFNNYYNNSKES